LLRFSTVARNALMDSTLGSADAFTEGTVKEVLEAAKHAVLRDTEEALAQEHTLRLGAENAARTSQQDRENLIAGLRAKAHSWSLVLGRLIRIVSTSARTALILYGLLLSMPDWYAGNLRITSFLPWIAILAFAGFTSWSLLTGGTVRMMGRALEVRVSDWVELRILGVMGFVGRTGIP